MRKPARLWLALAPLLCQPACRGAAPVRPDAQLIVHIGGAVDPLLFIDDHPVRTFPVRDEHHTQVAIPGGTHRVEVRAPGHFTAYQEITVPAQQRRTVQLTLRSDPDATASLPADPAGGR